MKINNITDLDGLGQWNNIRAFYNYSGTRENPQLTVNLALEISAYEPLGNAPDPLAISSIPIWQQRAIDDQRNFIDINFQLNRNYGELNIPGISGPAVSIFLTNTLLKSGKSSLSPTDTQIIRDFVADCLAYLTKRAEGQGVGDTSPACQLQIPVASTEISASDLIKLSLILSFEARDIPAQETGSILTDLPKTPGEKFECEIEDLTVSPQNGSIFAEAFEGLFFNEEWQLRIGKATPEPGLLGEQQIPALWALRMGKKPRIGFYFEIEDEPIFYAPRPIAKTLETATFPVSRYFAGEPFPADQRQMTFTDIDQNIWARTALSAIDAFLLMLTSPVDSLLSDKFESHDCIVKIRRHQQTIAGALAKTLIPILNTGANDEISLAAAQETFRSALSIRLSNAFTTMAVTVLGVSNVSVDSSQNPDKSLPSRFYGELQKVATPSIIVDTESLSTDPDEASYSLGSGMIRYFKLKDGQSGNWRLPFLFSTENAGKQREIALPPLAFSLTDLECNIIKAPEKPGGEEHTRIKFVTAPPVTPIGKDSFKFPVIRRELPAPPNLMEQMANSNVDPINAETCAPSELAVWNYLLAYDYQAAAQDFVTLRIALDRQNHSDFSGSEAHPLFAPLAQFVMAYQEILSDFEISAGRINSLSEAAGSEVVSAGAALAAFEKITGDVAAGFDEWANPAPEIKSGDAPANLSLFFDVALESCADGRARIDVINSNLSDPASPVLPPLVEIEPFIRVTAPDKPGYALASYNYVLPQSSSETDANEINGSQTYLSYEDALNISSRTVILKGLNVFTAQNVRGQIQVIRNGFPAGASKTAIINDAFKFMSPVMFADSLNPSPRFTDFDFGSLSVSSPALENYLNSFFDLLLKQAVGLSLRLKMEVSFSFEPVSSLPGSPRTILPITIVPLLDLIPQNDEPLPFISPLAGAITNWTSSTDPALNSNSEYNLRLEIFGEKSDRQAAQMPLMTIENLFIKAEKIKFG
jgi:hypothetical protein